MTNAASVRQIAEARARSTKLADTERTILSTLMSRPDGRAWVWSQLKSGQVFHEDLNLDPHYMAYVKGMRRTALTLWSNILDQVPLLTARMIEENASVQMTPQTQEDRDGGRTDDDE